MAIPVLQADRVDCTESERRFGAVDRNGHELAQVAASRGLVQHPVGADRGLGPQDEDSVAALEGGLDLAREDGAALDQRIPPQVETRGFQGFREPSQPAAGRRVRN